MSFFDETKNFGLVLLICAVLSIVFAVFMMTVGIDNTKMGVLAGVGTIVGALIILVYALGVYRGEYLVNIDRYMDDASTKFGVLTGFVTVNGVSCIVSAIFSIIGGDVGGAVLNIVIGVLCFVMAFFMTDNEKGIADNVIFIILAIIFVLMIIGGILTLIVLIGIPILIEGIMLLIMLFSPEVKEKMGM